MRSLSPVVPEKVVEYIRASGFNHHPSLAGYMCFSNLEMQIVIFADTLQVNTWFSGDNDRADEWRQLSKHENISLLTFEEWVLLLHICGAIQSKYITFFPAERNLVKFFQ